MNAFALPKDPVRVGCAAAPRLAHPARVPLCLPLWGSPPPSPVAGNTNPRTADSRSCTDSGPDQPRTLRSTAHQPPPHPCWPSPFDTPPRPPPWRSETACPATSVRSPGSSRRCRLASKRTRATRPLRSARITGPHRYYETVRPCAPHRYSAPHSFRCLGCSLRPVGATAGQCRWGDRFPRSVPMPDLSSRHLYAGHHLASQQAPARLVPGQRLDPGFYDIARLSTLHQWFTHVRLLRSHLTHLVRLFRNAHHHDS